MYDPLSLGSGFNSGKIQATEQVDTNEILPLEERKRSTTLLETHNNMELNRVRIYDYIQ